MFYRRITVWARPRQRGPAVPLLVFRGHVGRTVQGSGSCSVLNRSAGALCVRQCTRRRSVAASESSAEFRKVRLGSSVGSPR